MINTEKREIQELQKIIDYQRGLLAKNPALFNMSRQYERLLHERFELDHHLQIAQLYIGTLEEKLLTCQYVTKHFTVQEKPH